MGFDILNNFTKTDTNEIENFETILGSGYVTTRIASSNLDVAKNSKPTKEVFPMGLPDQFTIVFLFEAIDKMKSWVQGLISFLPLPSTRYIT